MIRIGAALLGLIFVLSGQTQTPNQATVPLLLEGNRPFVEILLARPDGTKKAARFLVDTGGGGFLIAEPLAREIGLTWGATAREEGMEFGLAAAAPAAYLGDMPLALNPARVFVVIGAKSILPKAAPGYADGMFPGHVLAKYHVVFDYPARTFTIAAPNTLKPRGEAMPMPVGRTGFPRTEIDVAGTAYPLLLDTGASFTMVSEVVLKTWGAAHADWPRQPGAVGEATTLGGMALETMTLPGGRWGALPLTSFGVVSQREGTFERYMTSMMKAPIVGALAGNVLTRFRVELDYPNEKLYLSTAR